MAGKRIVWFCSLLIVVGFGILTALFGCGSAPEPTYDLPPFEISLELTKSDGTAYWVEFCFSASELTYDRVKVFRVDTEKIADDVVTAMIPKEVFTGVTLGIGKSKKCEE